MSSRKTISKMVIVCCFFKNVPVAEIIYATKSAILRGSLEQYTSEELRSRINMCILSAKDPKLIIDNEDVNTLHALRKEY